MFNRRKKIPAYLIEKAAFWHMIENDRQRQHDKELLELQSRIAAHCCSRDVSAGLLTGEN